MTGLGPAQSPAPSALRVAYLAEVPLSWRSGLVDPLRSISQSFGSAFAHPVDPEYPLAGGNLFGAESWEELARTIQLDEADLFPLHAYELLERARTLNLKPLLLATRRGRWQTRFVLLAAASSQIQQLRDLENRKVLVHRDGCGNLVDYWLDSVIAVGTGHQRKNFARYQTVTQAREAVLPVFFGEADACVVSVAAYQSVVAQNPVQIPGKLNLVLAESKELPTQVVACRMTLPLELQRRIMEQGTHLTWDFGDETGTLVPAEDPAFDNLRALLGARVPEPAALTSSPVPPIAKLPSATAGKRAPSP